MSPELIISIEIAIILALVLMSAFFSGSETALFSLSRARLFAYRTDPDPRRQIIVRLMTDYNHTLVALVMGNMFVNSGISLLDNELLEKLEMNPIVTMAVSIFISVIILLLFGEITPKTIAFLNCEKVADFVAKKVWYFRLFLMPLIKVMEKDFAIILDLLGRKKQKPLNVDEYFSYVEMARTVGAFTVREAELLRNIFSLRKSRVGRAMRTRTSIECVRKDMTAAEVEGVIRESRQLFYPVGGRDIDDADYFLSVRGFFLQRPEERERWLQSGCVFKAVFVPENATLAKALSLLRKDKIPVALVCDEYGGISGMLHLKDIYEEIVGDIEIEFEAPDSEVVKVSDGVWKVAGTMMTSSLCDLCGWQAPESSPNTINGIFQGILERIPLKGDSVELGGARFTVLNVSDNLVREAEFRFSGPARDAREGAAE